MTDLASMSLDESGISEMKTIIVYYFSGTGNTWWIANELSHRLLARNINVQCCSIEKLELETVAEQIKDAGHLIFGFPAYGSIAPKIMLDFIDRFPAASPGQSVSTFATHALASGDTAYFTGQLLVKKGYELTQAIHFRMMNNFHLPGFKFCRPKNDHRLAKMLQKAHPRVDKLARAIIGGKKYMVGRTIVDRFLGRLQRRHIDSVISNLSGEFRVDSSRCINCDKCASICPAENIAKHETGYLFGAKCILCLRCYSFCPRAAILIGEGSLNEVLYPRYKGPGKEFDITECLNKTKPPAGKIS